MTAAVKLPSGTLLLEGNLIGVRGIVQGADGHVSAGAHGRPLDGTCLHPLESLNKLTQPGVILFSPPEGVEKPAKNLVTIDGAPVLLAPSKLGKFPPGGTLSFIWHAISGCECPAPDTESWESFRKYSKDRADFLADHVRGGARFVSQFRSSTLGYLREEVGSSFPLAYCFRNRFSHENSLLDTEYGREFLSSVLCADTVSFHTQDQADAFLETVKGLMDYSDLPFARPVGMYEKGIIVQDPDQKNGQKGGQRLVKAQANPIAIEVETERRYAQEPETVQEVEKLEELTKNKATGEQRRVVLINGSCDERKNVPAMVEAYVSAVENGDIDPTKTVLYVKTPVEYNDARKIIDEEQERTVARVREKIERLNKRLRETIDVDGVIFDPTSYGHHERVAQALVADVHLFVSGKNSIAPSPEPKRFTSRAFWQTRVERLLESKADRQARRMWQKRRRKRAMEGYGTAPLSLLAVNPAVRCVLGPGWLTPVAERLGEIAVLTKSASVKHIKAALVEALAPESDEERDMRARRTREISEAHTAEDWSRELAEGVRVHPVPAEETWHPVPKRHHHQNRSNRRRPPPGRSQCGQDRSKPKNGARRPVR